MNGYRGKLVMGVLSVAMFGAVVALWPMATSGQEQQVDKANAWAKYQIILDRNIFSRTRGPRVVNRPGEKPDEPAVVNPESYYRLKGIAQENGTFIAFIEDTRYNTVLRVRDGQSIARGVVKDLTLDSLGYEYNGKTVTVQVGRDLEGGFGAVTQSELRQWTPTEATSGSTTSEPTTEEATDILEQLRQRRQQQLGR